MGWYHGSFGLHGADVPLDSVHGIGLHLGGAVRSVTGVIYSFCDPLSIVWT